jgi:hypothetical protein
MAVPEGWKLIHDFPLPEEDKARNERVWHKSLLKQEDRKEDSRQCFECGKLVEHRKICTGCQQVVFYCDKSCQKLHWKVHKEECKKASVQPNPLQDKLLIYTRNLGTNPSREVKKEALLEFQLRMALGLSGADNPCPMFKDEKGLTRFL